MSDSESIRRKNLVSFCTVAFFCAVFLWILTLRHWSDSEIWGVRQGAACLSDWSRYSCGWKPLFNALAGGTQLLVPGGDLSSSLLAARSLTALAWLGSVFAFVRYGRSLLLLICFAGSSAFLIDASVARADLWALPFLLVVFGELERREDADPRLIAGAALAAVLLTPKSALALLCAVPFLVPFPFAKVAPARNRRFWVPLALLGVLALLGALFFDWAETGRFFLRLFRGDEFGFSYLSPLRFSFLQRAFAENPHWVPLLFLALLGVASVPRRALPGLLVLAALFLYPDKLPFFVSAFFLLFLFASGPWWKGRNVLNKGLLVCAVLGVLNGIHWISQAALMTNARQAEFSRRLDRGLALTPYARVFDSLGIAAGKAPPPYFIGPGQKEGNERLLPVLRHERFEVIVMTRKLTMMGMLLYDEIYSHYVSVDGGLWLRSLDVPPLSEGADVLAPLEKAFAPHLTRLTEIGLFTRSSEDEEWNLVQDRVFTLEELPGVLSSCELCARSPFRLTPFGGVIPAPDILPEKESLDQLFGFESPVPRKSAWQILKERF